MKNLYQRSDNAGCYAANSVAEIMYVINREGNSTIIMNHMGKDQSDRESLIAKCYINSYVHSGKNCLSAEEIKKRITYIGGSQNNKLVQINHTKAMWKTFNHTIPYLSLAKGWLP